MIIIVGNILKDIYLNLDSRTEDFEQDKHHTKWLNLAFNASEHHFFTRNSSLSGAAISLEVLSKLGLDSAISGSELKLTTDGLTTNGPAETYRYILITDGQTSYLTPSQASPTDFTPPTEPVEYIYIDRSAHLTANTIAQIIAYLDISQTTKLILYLSNSDNPQLTKLIPRASLIFHEKPQSHHQLSHSKHLTSSELNQALDSFDPSKIIRISDTHLSYQNISEPISINRINMLTHLSAYSIASATILGCFILGYSVEDSLKLARINLEHSKLNSTLTLDELQSTPVDPTPDLSLIASSLVIRPKGILAADESGGSIHKKF